LLLLLLLRAVGIQDAASFALHGWTVLSWLAFLPNLAPTGSTDVDSWRWCRCCNWHGRPRRPPDPPSLPDKSGGAEYVDQNQPEPFGMCSKVEDEYGQL
jgi:hypothetical protein